MGTFHGVIEPLTPEELDRLKQEVQKRIQEEGNSLMANYMDVDRAAECLYDWSKSHKVLKIYHDNTFCGIFAFDNARPWWSRVFVICEICIFSFGHVHGVQRFALDFMHCVASEMEGPVLLAGGCIFQENPQQVTNGYLRMGFTEAYPTYTKVIVNDHQ